MFHLGIYYFHHLCALFLRKHKRRKKHQRIFFLKQKKFKLWFEGLFYLTEFVKLKKRVWQCLISSDEFMNEKTQSHRINKEISRHDH